MIRVRQLKIDVNNDTKEELEKIICKKLRIKNIVDYKISKKSIDARYNQSYFVYEVDVNIKSEDKYIDNKDIIKIEDIPYTFNISGTKKINNLYIVGAGPAGLFCAYMLAKNGYKPIVIERGKMVDDRIKDVEKFWETGILDENSNVQFGEGGAGTFSDGKLTTSVKDKYGRIKEVLKIFVECGAPESILYENKPHLGTDKLVEIVKNLRNKIIEMGGKFLFETALTNVVIRGSLLDRIVFNNKDMLKADALVLAIGHSSRDTYKMLSGKILMEPKPFAVGVRVIHPQELINKNQYKDSYKLLPPADYKLTYTTKSNRGVYSFCMCPGGFVVNASSEKKRLAINGMSNKNRDEVYANSAIIVSVSPNDYGYEVLDGVKFQETLEQKAFEVGNGLIPVSIYKDFKNNLKCSSIGNIKGSFKGKTNPSNLREVLPEFINESLIEAIENFDKKIPGFASDDCLIAAVESRSSSPVRIVRDETGQSDIQGIFPCGEGAGYAGGITSSAVDGIITAENIAKIWHF